MGVKKNKKNKNDKLYKYVVIYIGTIFMMVSPFFIDSNEGKVGMLIGLALITIQTQKTKQEAIPHHSVTSPLSTVQKIITLP